MTDALSPWMVIGYGNSLRRDDGAGLCLATRLVEALSRARPAVSLHLMHQLTPELAADIADVQPTVAVFVDTAAAAGASPVQIEQLAGGMGDAQHWGHHMTPAAVVGMTAQLFGWELMAFLITTPGLDFNHGEGLSGAVQALVDDPATTAALVDWLAAATSECVPLDD